jgi:hypothetical protein
MQLIDLVAHSSEFENIMVREEEQQELANVVRKSCPLEVRGGPEDKYGKINILIQVFWSPPWFSLQWTYMCGGITDAITTTSSNVPCICRRRFCTCLIM